MPNYFYVRNDGTAGATTDDGVYTSFQSGDFDNAASNDWQSKGFAAADDYYYANINDALNTGKTTDPTAGDFIVCSSAHNHAYGVDSDIFLPHGVTVISVDDTNADQYLKGATETGNDMTLQATAEGSTVMYQGMSILGSDMVEFTDISVLFIFDDGEFGTTGSANGDVLRAFADGVRVELSNSILHTATAASYFQIGAGACVTFRNVTGDVGNSTPYDHLLLIAGAGGQTFNAYDTDFTNIIKSNGFLVDTSTAADDNFRSTLKRCKLNTGFSLWETTPTANFSWEVDISSCTDPGNDDHNAYHYFLYANGWAGQAEEDVTEYLDATYDGTLGFSTQFTANARCSVSSPLRYMLGTLSAQVLSTDQTVTVKLTSDASLTNTDIWLELVHNNNTDEALGDIVSSRNSDILAAGTALPADGVGGWAVGDTADYAIALAIGALSNVANGTVEVWACTSVANIVANFDQPTIADT